MDPTEALSLAIFAINTLQHSDASSVEDGEYLDAHAGEALAELVRMREEIDHIQGLIDGIKSSPVMTEKFLGTSDPEGTHLPEPARKVVDECIAEAWRNTEQNDGSTEVDVAADIAERLHFIYRVKSHDDDRKED